MIRENKFFFYVTLVTTFWNANFTTNIEIYIICRHFSIKSILRIFLNYKKIFLALLGKFLHNSENNNRLSSTPVMIELTGDRKINVNFLWWNEFLSFFLFFLLFLVAEFIKLKKRNTYVNILRRNTNVYFLLKSFSPWALKCTFLCKFAFI